MGALEHEGQRVRYETRGSGPTLLFLHGLGADRRQGESVACHLRGWRLVLIDMPGHGESLLDRRRGSLFQPGFASYATIARRVLDALQVETCALGGISMGAGIALTLALEDPARFEALVLLRPAWLDEAHPRHLAVIASMGGWIRAHGVQEADRRLQALPFFEALQADLPLAAGSVRAAITRTGAEAGAEALVALVADRPFTDLAVLESLDLPVLLLANRDDPLHPEDVAARLAASLPKATSMRVPPRYRDPDAHRAAVADAIADFLSRTTPAAQPETLP